MKKLAPDVTTWSPRTVDWPLETPRSYIVENDKHNVIRRNGIHLRPIPGIQGRHGYMQREDHPDRTPSSGPYINIFYCQEMQKSHKMSQVCNYIWKNDKQPQWL